MYHWLTKLTKESHNILQLQTTTFLKMKIHSIWMVQ